MITDDIGNAQLYTVLGKGIERALKFIQNGEWEGMLPGKYEIDGEETYAVVSQYETKSAEECTWEAHKKYIDIHFIAEGTEEIGYAKINDLKVIKEYDDRGDCQLLEGRGSMICCKPKTFIIFWPQDAHMPGAYSVKPESVRKIVFKIKL